MLLFLLGERVASEDPNSIEEDWEQLLDGLGSAIPGAHWELLKADSRVAWALVLARVVQQQFRDAIDTRADP